MSAKDVKSNAMLPQKVSGSATAPVARPVSAKPKKRVVLVEDYVSVDGDAKTDALSPPSPSSSDDKDDYESNDAADTLRLAKLRITDLTKQLSDRSSELTGMLLEHRRERSSPADSKHFYSIANVPAPAFGASGAETVFAIANPTQGTGVNQRLGNQIAIRSIKIRICYNLVPLGTALTASPTWPRLSAYVLREKFPTAPASFPILFSTDANPPASATALMSRLGQTQSPENDRCAVINPVSYDRYHIYHIRHSDSATWAKGADRAYQSVTVPVTGTISKCYHEEFIHIRCNDVKVQYQTATANATVNATWLTMRTDYAGAANDTANGFQVAFVVSSDCEFYDVQDDGEYD